MTVRAALALLHDIARRAGWTQDELGDWWTGDPVPELVASEHRWWRRGEIDPVEVWNPYVALLLALGEYGAIGMGRAAARKPGPGAPPIGRDGVQNLHPIGTPSHPKTGPTSHVGALPGTRDKGGGRRK